MRTLWFVVIGLMITMLSGAGIYLAIQYQENVKDSENVFGDLDSSRTVLKCYGYIQSAHAKYLQFLITQNENYQYEALDALEISTGLYYSKEGLDTPCMIEVYKQVELLMESLDQGAPASLLASTQKNFKKAADGADECMPSLVPKIWNKLIEQFQRSSERVKNNHWMLLALIGLLIVSSALISYVFLLHLKTNQRLKESQQELEEKNEELRWLSVTDPLTGLYNRNKLDAEFESELKRVQRYGHPLGVILLDIDYFKNVNDTCGHQVGDKVLILLADILRQHTRNTDIIGRWGGEEFLILLPETDCKGAYNLAEHIRQQIESFHFPEVNQKTASLGVSCYQSGDDEDRLVSRADEALYRAKEKGRNCVETA